MHMCNKHEGLLFTPQITMYKHGATHIESNVKKWFAKNFSPQIEFMFLFAPYDIHWRYLKLVLICFRSCLMHQENSKTYQHCFSKSRNMI